MNIIRAEKKHISSMAEIEKQSFPDPWSEAAFESSLCSQAEIILAAIEDGKMAGYIIGNCDGYQGYIENFAVSPHMRRRGIGDRLLEAFICALPDTAEEIALEVRETNSAAIAIYEKNGFETVGIRKNFYSDPKENGIVMIRRIERDKDEC